MNDQDGFDLGMCSNSEWVDWCCRHWVGSLIFQIGLRLTVYSAPFIERLNYKFNRETRGLSLSFFNFRKNLCDQKFVGSAAWVVVAVMNTWV